MEAGYALCRLPRPGIKLGPVDLRLDALTTTPRKHRGKIILWNWFIIFSIIFTLWFQCWASIPKEIHLSFVILCCRVCLLYKSTRFIYNYSNYCWEWRGTPSQYNNFSSIFGCKTRIWPRHWRENKSLLTYPSIYQLCHRIKYYLIYNSTNRI